ncbi:MAG: bacteriohopanetetrol glucosamine biosynthesis glycosyltransferase HpnI [Acidiferrobacteraceae bacterium]
MAQSPVVLDRLVPLTGLLVEGAALAYALTALVAVLRWGRRDTEEATDLPEVTVLKPLHGLEHDLYRNLRSFCDQDYPDYQIVFGVQDPDDPALAVAHRLRQEFPDRAIDVVIEPRVLGPNRKASNLAHMMAVARYDCVVTADADIHVGRDYLRRVVAPLRDPATGVVTCLYRGRPGPGFWSAIAAESVNNGFAPSVLVARLLGIRSFCSGATMGMRRVTLDAIGGFAGLTGYLADDYQLAAEIRALGLQTVLSSYVVETTMHEPDARSFFQHELRWLRTVRTLAPAGYVFSAVTYPLPVSLVGVLLGHATRLALAGAFVVLLLRLMLYFATRNKKTLGVSGPSALWMIPARDFVSFGLWAVGLFGRRVRWQGQGLIVNADGHVELNKETL